MAYKNTLKGYLKFEKTNEEQKFFLKTFDLQGRYYNLSHSFGNKKDPQEMNIKEIKEYIEDNYVNADFVNKYELINDLNIFKSLREEIKIKDNSHKFLVDTVSFLITILAIALAVAVGFLSVEDKVVSLKFCDVEKFYKTNMNFVLSTIKMLPEIGALYIFLYYMAVGKNFGLNKLKTINHVIFTLEAIEENLVEVPENFDVEVKNLSDEKVESRRYSVKVKESLEDNSK